MRWFGPCWGALALLGCQPGELPGTPVGTYDIVGELVENTCGTAALPAREPLQFSVELRDLGGAGIWIVGEPPGFSGTYSDRGEFRFTRQSQYVAIAPSSETNEPEEVEDFFTQEPASRTTTTTPGCTLTIRETIDGRAMRTIDSQRDAGVALAPGADAADLLADNTIEIAPTGGSDCLRALQAGGGPFVDLPCAAHYELAGTLVLPDADAP